MSEKVLTSIPMMLRSQLFSPTGAKLKIRNKPGILSAKSTDLLEKAGYIKASAPGIYGFLPLGQKVLDTIIQIIDKNLQLAGCQKMQMPILTTAELWKATNRWNTIGNELIRVKDRNGLSYCLGPTHEEAFTEVVAQAPMSHKSLPLKLYQITTKYRDEIRPRHGLIRCREFLMKDLYSFDMSKEKALDTYNEIFKCYQQIFTELKLPAVPVLASSGKIGGNYTHEFQVSSPIGDDDIVSCPCGKFNYNIEVATRKITSPFTFDFIQLLNDSLLSSPSSPAFFHVNNKSKTTINSEEGGDLFYNNDIAYFFHDFFQERLNPNSSVDCEKFIISPIFSSNSSAGAPNAEVVESSKSKKEKKKEKKKERKLENKASASKDTAETETEQAEQTNQKSNSTPANHSKEASVDTSIPHYYELIVYKDSKRKINLESIEKKLNELNYHIVHETKSIKEEVSGKKILFDWSIHDVCTYPPSDLKYQKTKSSSGNQSSESKHNEVLPCFMEDWGEFTQVMQGDACAQSCCTHPAPKLNFHKAIEVGQTFYLGKKYSSCFNAFILDSTSKSVHYEMGCFGIGVSRIVQTLAEIYHTPTGLRWPINVAPYIICIVPAGPSHFIDAKDFAAAICEWWPTCTMDKIIIDDRFKVKFPQRIEDNQLLGAPFILTVGEKWVSSSVVYLQTRTIDSEETADFKTFTELKNFFKNLNNVQTI